MENSTVLANNLNLLLDETVDLMNIEDEEIITSLNNSKINKASNEDNVITYPVVSTWKRNLFKGLTLASVLLNPLFAIFLYKAIADAMEETQEALGLENQFWEMLFIFLNFTVSSLSGISDIIVVNPIEEADELLESATNVQLLEKINLVVPRERKIIKTVTYFNQAVGNTVFLVGSASAALSVAYLTKIPALRWSISLPITALEHIYLYLLSKAKIDEHSYEFIHRLLDNKKSMFLEALKSPAKSLEVIIQVVINALNRGVVYGYIMEQILKEFFNLKSNDRIGISLITYMASASFYNALFSRTLNVYKHFFNPQFNVLSEHELRSAKISYVGLCVDGLMTLLRAGAISVLLYRHSFESKPLNIIVFVPISLFFIGHGFYVRYHNRLYQTALDIKLKQQVLNSNIEQQQTMGKLQPAEIFDLIKARYKVSNGIKISATFINVGSRMANWFSFLGFLITMNKIISQNTSVDFDFYDLLCIQQLLCNPSLENELSFFQETMIDILAYYRTKLYLEKNKPLFGWSCFWKSKADYSSSYLQSFLTDNIATISTNNIEMLEPTDKIMPSSILIDTDALDIEKQKNSLSIS